MPRIPNSNSNPNPKTEILKGKKKQREIMENSYIRSPWNPNHTCFPNHQNLTPEGKFVSIPVRFVESASESNRKHSAAVRIQRLVRGFLVRKKVGVVRRIEREAEEIERRIERDLDLLLREEKERIRINEMLMALLLRLDSVRGVRDYRRKVIRKAISMQEAVDTLSSLSAKPEEAGGGDASTEYQETLGIEEDAAIEVQETLETQIPEGTLANQESEVQETLGTIRETLETQILEGTLANQESEVHEPLGTITDQEIAEETLENQGEAVLEFREALQNIRENPGNSDKMGSEVPGIKNQETCQEEPTGEDQEIPVREIGVVDEVVFPMMEEDGWSIIEAPECDAKPEKTEESAPKQPSKLEKEKSEELELKGMMERMCNVKPEKTEESATKQPSKPEKENSEEVGLKGMMERMLAENANLKGMLVELCERSTMQCKLMGGLAKRVEQLEMTVQAMESRKKKKLETNSALLSEK